MNKKYLLIPAALAIALMMLASPVLAAATTYHFEGKQADAYSLYDPVDDLYMELIVTEGKTGTYMFVALWTSGFYWDNYPGQLLAKGEFKWSMDHATLSTIEAFTGLSLTAQWDTIAPTETGHYNDWTIPGHLHTVENANGRCATAMATFDGATFYYYSGYSAAFVEHYGQTDIYK